MARRLVLAVMVTLAAALGPAFSAQRASAEVVEVGASTVGLQPRSTALFDTDSTDGFENAEGHAVVGSSKVYAVYWDPDDQYHGNWQELINEFFANLSKSSGSLDQNLAVDTQYTDSGGARAGSATIFAGAYTDTDGYPALAGCADPDPLTVGAITCLSGAQIESELETFIKDHSLPTGMNAIYYVLTPPGVTDCLADSKGQRCSDYSSAPGSYEQSFCSYHAAINPGGSPEGGPQTILFAAIPWTAGGLGDYHLAPADEVNASDCQDGGWEPGNAESKQTEAKEGTPVEQEPNQSGLGPDGSYDAGLADLIINQIAVEQQDIVTDPLMGSWRTTTTPVGTAGNQILGEEVTDLCRDFFAPAIGGNSGAETVEEAEAREERVVEAETKLAKEHPEWSSAEVKKEAEKEVGTPRDGEENTHAGTLYNAEVGEGHYYLNDTFDLAGAEVAYPGVTCLQGASLVPSFTPPTNANAGEIIGFDGMESTITLNEGTVYEAGIPKPTYPVFEWNFGDGTTVKGYAPGASSGNPPENSLCEEPWLKPCAASAFHSYTYGGTYEVTLTVTDVGGHTASVTKSIHVDGPAPPSSGGGSGGSTTTPGSGGSGGGAGTEQTQSPGSTNSGSTSTGTEGTNTKTAGKSSKSSKTTTLTSPKLTAVVLTKTTSALAKGLKVSYSVNEQAAGRFEVLVAKSLAKKLGLSGSAASGLPKGAAAETVIAHALLVTTHSAKRTIEISIPKRSVKRLAKLSSLTLTLRVSARDASASDPQVSVLTTGAKLTH